MTYSSTHQNSICRQAGITLYDLLIAISILSVLTAIAIPSFTHTLKNNQRKTTIQAVKQLLNFARQEAVNRSQHVTVCSSENETICSSDWQYPFIVFVDSNRNHRLDQDELLLRRWDGVQTLRSLRWRSSLNRAYVNFDENGSTRYQSGRIYYCDLSSDSNQYNAQLIVYRTGRIRIAPEAELRSGCG